MSSDTLGCGDINCDDFSERLVDIVYDELPANERRELERHAESCADCRAKLETARATLCRLDNLAPLDARVGSTGASSTDLGRVLVAAAARAERSARRWRAVGAAACALLALGAMAIAAATFRPHAAPIESAAAAHEAMLLGHDERLAAVEELVRLVAVEVESSSERAVRELNELRDRLRRLERSSGERWREINEDVRAVYHIAQVAKKE